jgi:hypothetical protein
MPTMSYQKMNDDGFQHKQMATPKTVNNASCDPVMTQIALDTSMFLNHSTATTSNNNKSRSLKRMSSNTANNILPNTKLAANSTAQPLAIFRFNPNTDIAHNFANNQYSMSLPSNYSNLMEFALTNTANVLDGPHQVNNNPQAFDLENFQMDDSCITSTDTETRIK